MTKSRLLVAAVATAVLAIAGTGAVGAVRGGDDDVGRNKEIARRLFLEGLNNQNWALLRRYAAPTFVALDLPPGYPQGVAGLKKDELTLRAAMPDLRFTIQYLVGQGDVVAVRWTACGRFTRTFRPFGSRPLKPNGKTIRWTGSRWFNIVDGKVVSSWANIDIFALLAQTGGLPVKIPEQQCPRQGAIKPKT
jgi:predicted ester cyclase